MTATDPLCLAELSRMLYSIVNELEDPSLDEMLVGIDGEPKWVKPSSPIEPLNALIEQVYEAEQRALALANDYPVARETHTAILMVGEQLYDARSTASCLVLPTETEAIEQIVREGYERAAERGLVPLEQLAARLGTEFALCQQGDQVGNTESKQQTRQRRSSPALSLMQLSKALVMDYRVFTTMANDKWDLQPDKDLKNRSTIDYNLLNDPGKERLIEEHTASLRAQLAQRSREKAPDRDKQKKT